MAAHEARVLSLERKERERKAEEDRWRAMQAERGGDDVRLPVTIGPLLLPTVALHYGSITNECMLACLMATILVSNGQLA